MAKYLITAAAGRNIGGKNNTGVGTVIEFPDGYADAYAAMGWLVARRPEPSEAPAVAAAEPQEDGIAEEVAGEAENSAQEAPQAVSGGKTSRKAAKAASAPENGV